MREVCFILVGDKVLRAYFGSATHIPDMRERWEVIWEHRHEITEIVHSHPGDFLGFSHEDLTTMEAVEAGTGKSFAWSIVTESRLMTRQNTADTIRKDAPWWLGLIRELSYNITETDWKGANSNERAHQHHLPGPKRQLPRQPRPRSRRQDHQEHLRRSRARRRSAGH